MPAMCSFLFLFKLSSASVVILQQDSKIAVHLYLDCIEKEAQRNDITQDWVPLWMIDIDLIYLDANVIQMAHRKSTISLGIVIPHLTT